MKARFWPLLLVILLAFFFRLENLGRRPLHFDEGNNVYFGLRAPQILQDSIDHAEADPPIHRLLLGGWMALVGTSPLAIRFLSALIGTLAVALTAQLGQALLRNRWQATVLALFMAYSAFHIDYSQEAKGYALVCALALASTLAWLRLIPNPHRAQSPVRVSLVYALFTAAMLGTHYFAAPLLAMQWVLALAAPSSAILIAGEGAGGGLVTRYKPLLLAQALACLPVLIWIALAWRGIIAGGTKAASAPAGFHPLAVLARIWGEFAVGRYAPEPMAQIGALLLVLCWLIGLALLWRRNLRTAFWLSASVVIAMAFAEGVVPRLSIFYPRFLLWALPLVLLPLTMFFTIRGWMGALAGLALVLPIVSLYRSPIDPQTDYRPLFADLRAQVRPGDVALGTYIWMDGMAASYAPETLGKLSWVRDFYLQDGSDIDHLMQPIQQRTQRVWHFNFARSPDDPATLSALWLRQHGAEVHRWQQGNLTVVLFDPTAHSLNPVIDGNASAAFEDLVSVTWKPANKPAHAGDALRVDLSWHALRKLDALGISLQLLNPTGALSAQQDQDAVNGLSPTITWQPKQPIADARALQIPPDAALGDYTLQLVIYRRDTGQRLTLANGQDRLVIGVVHVVGN